MSWVLSSKKLSGDTTEETFHMEWLMQKARWSIEAQLNFLLFEFLNVWVRRLL